MAQAKASIWPCLACVCHVLWREHGLEKLNRETASWLEGAPRFKVSRTASRLETVQTKYGGLETVQTKYGGLETVHTKYGGLETVQTKYGGLEPVQTKHGGLEPVQTKYGGPVFRLNSLLVRQQVAPIPRDETTEANSLGGNDLGEIRAHWF